MFYFGGVNKIKELQINEEIRSNEVRLIGKDGEQVGIVPINKALDLAADAGLDLVEVAPNAKPPVCKIIDYGKHKYEMLKKEKESKKKQNIINIKEIRMTPNIERHDLQTKANSAIKFLQNGDRLKISVRFRGREMDRTDSGKEVLDDFYELVKDYGEIDKKPKLEGRFMTMYVNSNIEE
ncbi:translation initiation factor IF-3 [Citroniella saccharovorans]|uniref:Translation initiation factor IF-3 n=1 Tax=Citroniella saccharovorans TaxID=2053367 RepID=A0AAW9MZ33_9FIRM|nr:translation initiation factor IF-3 [Citroniella saccharovorans]MEB3429734.1 translation initiation factor IF-3 [Citroniella saccharovorans]